MGCEHDSGRTMGPEFAGMTCGQCTWCLRRRIAELEADAEVGRLLREALYRRGEPVDYLEFVPYMDGSVVYLRHTYKDDDGWHVDEPEGRAPTPAAALRALLGET
jgi:hypothetical protein